MKMNCVAMFAATALMVCCTTSTASAVNSIESQLHDLQEQVNLLHRKLQEHNHMGGMDGGSGAIQGANSTDDTVSNIMTGEDHIMDGHMDHSSHSSPQSSHGSFFTTGEDTTILFEGWTTDSYGDYIGSCIFVIFLGILLEAITTFRMVYPNHVRDLSTSAFITMHTPRLADNVATAAGTAGSSAKTVREKPTWGVHAVKSVLYAFGITIAYTLMLVIMTFNVGLFISAVLGLTIGFFFFGMVRSRAGASENDSSECCHNVA